jgi:hypothetical protein
MNRRSFFKTLSAAVAGTVVLPPAITFDRCWKYPVWKKSGDIWIINPEWENAPYEIGFHFPTGRFPIIHPRLNEIPGHPPVWRDDPVPVRFRNWEDAQALKPIDPFITLASKSN